MKTVIKVFISLLAPLFCNYVFAQNFSANRTGQVGLPYFETQVLSTFSQDNGIPIAKIYLQFVNDNLTFVKSEPGYVAEMQIEINITNSKNDYVFSRTVDRKIQTLEYSNTNSQDIRNTIFIDVEIEGGEYEALITLTDKNTSKQFMKRTNFEIKAPGDDQSRFLLSDILFFNKYEQDEQGKIISFNPEMSHRFTGDHKYLYAYFNTYSFNLADSVEINYVVKDEHGKIVQRNKYFSVANDNYLEHFIKLNRYNLKGNYYSVEVTGSSAGYIIENKAAFSFYWHFFPNTELDLDMAIEQLKYIADGKTIKKFRKANYAKKKELFVKFWAAKDPNPDTEVNELMEEFYRRVELANRNFSAHGLAGWITDQGRIYIKFGNPDDIERHPFEAQTNPYQIWRYYILQKNFLFIDRTGFGDFDLHPSYYYVEFE